MNAHTKLLPPLSGVPTPSYPASPLTATVRSAPSISGATPANALLNAAMPLLSQVAGIRRSLPEENLYALNARLADVIGQFDDQAQEEGVDNSDLVAARYILCTLADEVVTSTPWGKDSEWSQISLLARFHNETFGGEKVFRLLDQLLRNPLKHLDTLELLYVCLALGFEGKYRIQPRGAFELETIRDNLYRQIQHLRGPVSSELSPNGQRIRSGRQIPLRRIPTRAMALLTLVTLMAFYGGCYWALQQQRNSVLQAYQQELSR